MYKISVICPVYNSEKYIRRTINSIINQSFGFQNIELILVDDCSTDSSREIINEYVKKYENIKLYWSDTNHGFPGYGRNVGIEKSSADYVMFIDNDDEYCPTFCETAYNSILDNSCDVVSANYLLIHNNNITKENIFSKVSNNTKEDIFSIDLDGFYNFSSAFVWTKIFKKSIILKNDIRFVEDRWGEDVLFLWDFFYHANRLVCIDYYGYKWYRDGSNLSYFSKKATLGILNSYYDIYDSVSGKYDNVDYEEIFRSSVEGTIMRICMSFDKISEIKPMILELYKFEKHVNFNGELPHYWATIVNNFILKRHFTIVVFMLWCIRKVKTVVDLING